MKNTRIEEFRSAITPSRERLVNHPVYSGISSIGQLRTFMEYHVFAVWDFMSLLKYLQRELTCVHVPWMPKGTASTRYLINEIVTGEESDVDPDGNRISHFELYLEAMRRIGADTGPIERFVQLVGEGADMMKALESCGAPAGAVAFVKNTFLTIGSGKTHVVAAVFTFGREDLIPDMFLQLIKGLQNEFPEQVGLVRYYVERHIEVDGGHHGELALQMTAELCGDDEQKWSDCEREVIAGLESRASLWDSIRNANKLSPVVADL
ncbi:MAG: DUF3050 domain-containing protein [Bacteroidota bacterium]